MKRLVVKSLLLCGCWMAAQTALAQSQDAEADRCFSLNRTGYRFLQYYPQGDAFVGEGLGQHMLTRPLYGPTADYRVETSDRPFFAVIEDGQRRTVRFEIEGVPLDSTDYCKSWYRNGMRTYLLGDHRWNNLGNGIVRVHVVALPHERGAVWQFIVDQLKDRQLEVDVHFGDGSVAHATRSLSFAHLVMKHSDAFFMNDGDAFQLFQDAVNYNKQLAATVQLDTPDDFLNTLGGALVMAARGAAQEQVSRGAYANDVLGQRQSAADWLDAQAQAVASWNDLDAQLAYLDALLWHYQYDADPAAMRRQWPVVRQLLAGTAGAVSAGLPTRQLAYLYRANQLAAQVAALIGEDATACQQQAATIQSLLGSQLWLPQGHWAERRDPSGLQRVHEHATVASIYAPIDCGVSTAEQAYQATHYIDDHIPHFTIDSVFYTISSSDMLPLGSGANSVSAAEALHTALAFFEAGRPDEGYRLLRGTILDQLYYGASPGRFGSLSEYDGRADNTLDDADCVGIAARAIVQGLFGIEPQALSGQCIIRPGFPCEWDNAAIVTPYINYKFTRANGKDRYEITQQFAQPLKVVLRQNLGGGKYRDVEGTAERYQVIEIDSPEGPVDGPLRTEGYAPLVYHFADTPQALGLSSPGHDGKYVVQNIDHYLNAAVADAFNGAPQPRPEISATPFGPIVSNGQLTVQGVPFRMPTHGNNVIFTSLAQAYPDSVVIPLKGSASSAYLLMAGTTSPTECFMDNGIVTVTYMDGTTDVMPLRNPDNWCPMERDNFAWPPLLRPSAQRPYRISLSTGTVGRDLLTAMGIDAQTTQGIIPGGAAQMLRMPLNKRKKLQRITVRTLSNDVVIGLMALTLQ